MGSRAEYEFLAYRFNKVMDLLTEEGGFTEESDAQHEVILEEFEEYEEAYENGNQGEVLEEMADVLITIFIQAERMNLDITQAYTEKMIYNLQKTGDKDENGKVVDDSEATKPDFSEMTDGFRRHGR